MFRRCLTALLNRVPPARLNEVRSEINRIIIEAEAEKSDLFESAKWLRTKARLKKQRLRDVAGWLLCSKCVAKFMMAFWWI